MSIRFRIARSRTRARIALLALGSLASFAALASACASSSDYASSGDPSKSSAVAANGAAAADSPTDAMAVLRAGGTFAFSLDESDPAVAIRDACAKSDPADPGACYAKVKTQGSKEKIKLVPAASGQVVFSSLGPDEGVDVVWIEVPLALEAEGAHGAVGTPAGTMKGAWAGSPKLTNARMRFEVVDATTIAMIDGKKGRLVFHKE